MNTLLQRLQISHRLALISLCYVVPTAVMLYMIVAGVNANIRFARLEMAGNNYQRALEPLLHLVSEHEMALAQPGQTDPATLQTQIDAALVHLTETDARLAEQLQFTDAGLALRKRDHARPAAFSREELERLVQLRTSELRERERELSESRAQLQRALDGSQLGTWEWDLTTDHVEFNAMCTDILGYSPGEIAPTRQAWTSLVHPDDLDHATAASLAHLEGRTTRYEVELRLRSKSGDWKWVRSTGRVVQRDASGRPLRVAGTHSDVHGRRTAELALQRRDEQLHLALAASGSALWDVDVEHKTVFLDERWPAIAGGPAGPRQLRLRDLLARVPAEDRRPITTAFAEVEHGATDDYAVEHRVRHEDGSLRWVRSRGRCVERDSNGRARRLIGTNTDITTLKQSQATSARQAELYSAINETALDLLARRDSADLLQALADRAATLMDTPAVEVSLIEGDKLVVRAHTGTVPPAGLAPVGREAFLSWRAIDTLQPVVVDDYNSVPGALTTYKQAGMHAIAVFPIVDRGHAIGVLGLCRQRPDHPFTLDDIQKGMLLAQLSALALHNASIYADAVQVADARTLALRQSEWQLREAQRIAHLGHWEYSFEHGNRVEHWSDETYRIFGLEPQIFPIDRARFDSLVHPDDLAHVRHEVDAAFGGRRKFVMNYRIRRADGTVRWIHDEGEPKLNAAGEVIGMQGIIQDVTDRAQTELALRESEEKFRGLFDHSPVPMVLVSYPEGRVADVNDAVTSLLGYSREECLDRHTLQSGIWQSEQARNAYLALLQRSGSIGNFEVTLRHRDGTALDLLLHSRLVQIGGSSYTLNTFVDVTHLRRIDRALRDSEKHYRTLVETITQGYYVANRRSQFTYCNPAIYAISGYTPEELKGTSCFRLVAPEARERVMQRYRDWIADPQCKNVSCEFPVLTKQGRSFWVEQTTDFVRDARGQVLEGRNMLRDISERKQAEQALRESEERFHAVFEESPVMILLLSFPEGKVVEANSAAARGFGLSREEAIGRTSVELMAWADNEDRNRYLALLKASRHVTGFETRMRRRNGEIFPVLFSGSLIEISGKSYTLNSIQDITAQRQAEMRLRQSQKMESLGTLAGGIAHDFNNLLTGILGSTELIKMDLPPGHSGHRWLENITTAGVRAKNLVQQILTFSRRTEGERGPVDLTHVCEEGLRLLRSTLPPMVELETAIDPACPPVAGDATQLQQVLMNLCTNAWHALPPEGGAITVRLEPVSVTEEQQRANPDLVPGPAVRLTVVDNGSGMPPDVLNRIFDPFFTTKPAGRGTGLGLAVVHGIVRGHGGAIVVQSQPGVGSRFEIFLPATTANGEERAAAATTLAAPPRGHGERILFVDDDSGPREALAGMLEHLGYRVTAVSNPAEALLKFSAAPAQFDLLLADYAMPGLTGLELARQIRTLRAELPIVIVSGHLDAEHHAESSRLRIAALVNKPPTLHEIARAIADALPRQPDSPAQR